MDVSPETIIKRKVAAQKGLGDKATIKKLGAFNPDEPNTIYSGGISLAKRLKQEDLTESEIKRIEATVPDYMTRAKVGGRVRCIDGRILKKMLDAYRANNLEEFEALMNRPLGFQTPGGVPYMGLAYRLASGQIEQNLSFDNDMEHVAKSLRTSNFPFVIGGHIDEHAPWPNTGCGAIDHVDSTLRKASDPEAIHSIYYWAKKIAYEDLWDEEVFDAAIGRIVRLQGIRDKYLLLDPKTKEFTYKRKAIEIVERFSEPDEDNMPPLTDEHLEAFIVVNKLPGYTFNSDLFYMQNRSVGKAQKAVQAFGWDIWSSRVMGNFFFDKKRPMVKAYFHARLILGIAALMVLTDGSPRVISIEK